MTSTSIANLLLTRESTPPWRDPPTMLLDGSYWAKLDAHIGDDFDFGLRRIT
ncbi:hypothetical protein [Mycolicibacterium sp. 120270]|uniref:hypothetical protein n=1 Tax=Mycolicibacterium sp. 120270 TaxID=3090600 RepID=UPI00299DD2FE|nr:hypothetical protein [Mycolicibacterium sp. 120270]MDX1883690.1 hypothetical protein [Mycolicibacterium sp. 120270]